MRSLPARMLPFYCKHHTVARLRNQAGIPMTFGERIRGLRKAQNLTLRALAVKLKINFTYLSKIENGKLDFGDYPSEDLIRKLAKFLGTDADELLLLAEKIPPHIKKRVIERPDAFRKFANLDDETLDRLLEEIERQA
jgi:HTH-type transcriptional regulator, competence development regulator